MAVKHESFLVLEESMARRLTSAWNKSIAPTLKSIVSATKKKDFNRAYTLVDKIDMTSVMEKNRKYIEFVGMSAILYGATRLHDTKKTTFTGKPKPEALAKGVRTTIMMLSSNGTEALRKKAFQLINLEENRQKDKAIQKASEYTPFAKAFTSSVAKDGKAFIDIGSSLHTSRLASWGFAIEAEVSGIEFYQVNEVLDGRTCPVCNEMHGKTFSVSRAKTKLESWLNVENPADLKSLAPWPKQDKASLTKLRELSNEELAGYGWDTPPYHPMCRGILTESGSVVSVEDLQIIPDQQGPAYNVPTPIPKAPRPKPAAAVASALVGSTATNLAEELVTAAPKTQVAGD